VERQCALPTRSSSRHSQTQRRASDLFPGIFNGLFGDRLALPILPRCIFSTFDTPIDRQTLVHRTQQSFCVHQMCWVPISLRSKRVLSIPLQFETTYTATREIVPSGDMV
jgi:hypothetical protein